jgi:hypothetical protein
VITQPLHIFQYGVYKLLANVRHTLLQVICSNLLKVSQGRACDNQLHLLCAKYFLRLSQRDGVAFTDVSQSLGHCLNKPQLFGCFLVII